MGGYGDPTVGRYELSELGVYVYGKYGTVQTYDNQAIDINTEICYERFLAVAIYPISYSNPLPKSTSEITYRSQEFVSNLEDYGPV